MSVCSIPEHAADRSASHPPHRMHFETEHFGIASGQVLNPGISTKGQSFSHETQGGKILISNSNPI